MNRINGPVWKKSNFEEFTSSRTIEKIELLFSTLSQASNISWPLNPLKNQSFHFELPLYTSIFTGRKKGVYRRNIWYNLAQLFNVHVTIAIGLN